MALTYRASDHIGRRLTMTSSNAGRWLASARFAIFFTLLFCAAYSIDQIRRLVAAGFTLRNLFETAMAVTIVGTLSAAAVAFLFARLGQLQRERSYAQTPEIAASLFLADATPTVKVLVPSYREEPSVIFGTVLSAALQEYPDLNIVLLIDDPPKAGDAAERALLTAARSVAVDVNALLDRPAKHLSKKLDELTSAVEGQSQLSSSQLRKVAKSFDWAAKWFDKQANVMAPPAEDVSHVDEFVAAALLTERADSSRRTAQALRAAAADGGEVSVVDGVLLLQRLAWVFSANVDSFERKQYASLSHAASKAMNLNSYLGLLGRQLSIESDGTSKRLVSAKSPASADLIVTDADYVLTLDADSILLPTYISRLVYLMEQPDHERTAIMQTPYSAFPNSPTRIERIAGATTDIQYLIHQGLNHYGASFWVGANALIRRSALDDIRSETVEHGKRIIRFISDRTVIEDTESSVDLRAKGWQIHNYPRRLSYSATPGDFGSLAIQRKRWANGGLLVLGSLVRFWRRPVEGVEAPRVAEVALRASYLASLATSALALAVILVYPFQQQLLSWFAVSVAVPYFVAMATDLRRCGYHRRDVFGLYVFNLVLLAVNLAGTMSSLVQGIGGHTVSFARTPKVKDRTVAQPLFIMVPLVLLLWTAYSFARELDAGNTSRALFVGLNMLAVGFGMVRFIGLRDAFVDLVVGAKAFVLVPRPQPVNEEPDPHWAAVLGLRETNAQVAQ